MKLTLKEVILLKLRTAFYKNGHLPLKMLFVRLSSSMWTCHQDEENPKEIQFNRVVATDEGFRTFLLKRQYTSETSSCSCHFKVGQESDLVDLRFPLQVPDNSSLMNIDKSVTEKRTSIVHPIGSTSTLDFVVIESALQVLAEKIVDWKKLGRKLLLPEEELQAIDVENRKHEEAVYQMLLKWKQKNGNAASYRGLGEALKRADRKDLQDFLYYQVTRSTRFDTSDPPSGYSPGDNSLSTGKKRLSHAFPLNEDKSELGTCEIPLKIVTSRSILVIPCVLAIHSLSLFPELN
ncbi:putative tumor necrosis factor receptor superfamily member 10B [Apostichopus japonicus]|uniref:Putative tumor necrosis factor receptor superfamily member 10B n=1 Tax=Stichopus japonicus TaxID=307972 RepID=A0A2G8KFH2_STIJA|nr:putative tumor necrosis factor receptor superfamily member 10B [Apostichopus japonicus]